MGMHNAARKQRSYLQLSMLSACLVASASSTVRPAPQGTLANTRSSNARSRFSGTVPDACRFEVGEQPITLKPRSAQQLIGLSPAIHLKSTGKAVAQIHNVRLNPPPPKQDLRIAAKLVGSNPFQVQITVTLPSASSMSPATANDPGRYEALFTLDCITRARPRTKAVAEGREQS